MNPLSLTTTYIETFFIRADNGKPVLRSYATGFFVRGATQLFLVTNWHVVSGLDPAKPDRAGQFPPPNYMKISVRSKDNWIVELTVPLYDEQMSPLWKEHGQRYAVDVVVYPLSLSLAQHFQMTDIRMAASDREIDEAVAKDVFILGYPFSREEMKSSFGDDAPYYLPVWKRGTIASEPRVRLSKKIILIDALSRPGMSGSPVLISEEREVMRLEGENVDVLRRLEQGTITPLKAISSLDTARMQGRVEKNFRLLGVYSGVIGNTRLEQVALGKCWHVDVLHELIASHQPGAMPFHSPLPNEFYPPFLTDLGVGKLTRKNPQGQITDVVPLS